MVLATLLNVCLLRANPQDLPASNALVGLALAAHFLANVLTGLDEANVENALIAGAMDTLLLVALTHTGLMLRNLRERTRQTLVALAGAGALLAVAAWAVVTATGMVTQQAWIVWLPFLFWFLAVYGHILRHAFNVTLGVGLLLATGYVLLSLMVTGPFLLADAPPD
ncbi:MAG: hypothetical protein EPN55_13390 [Gammaproteobacteria bacterium]|nr:MAG: hypothetical protein EPN55_13390 [Gammaproteobacteria bacterium]